MRGETGIKGMTTGRISNIYEAFRDLVPFRVLYLNGMQQSCVSNVSIGCSPFFYMGEMILWNEIPHWIFRFTQEVI